MRSGGGGGSSGRRGAIRPRAWAWSSSFATRSRAPRPISGTGRTTTGAERPGEDVLAPRRDLQLEPLVEILEGKRLVHAHCYRADEILMLIRLADDMGFKIATFQHVLEGYKVADEIAAHGAGASTFSDWWGYKVEAEDAIPYNAALMVRRGVLVSINSDSAEHARRLNTEAAKSIHWGGLTEDEAFALVTINPAKQLRIDNRVGSLEAGKDADVVIWNKHPLSTYAIVDRVYIDGTLYYDRLAEERRLTDARHGEEPSSPQPKAQRGPTADPQTSPRPQAATGSADRQLRGLQRPRCAAPRTAGHRRRRSCQPDGTIASSDAAAPSSPSPTRAFIRSRSRHRARHDRDARRAHRGRSAPTCSRRPARR